MTNIAKNKKIKIIPMNRDNRVNSSLRVSLGKSMINRKLQEIITLPRKISGLNKKIIEVKTKFRMLDSSGLSNPKVARELLTIGQGITIMENEKKVLQASLKELSGMFVI
ncbi:hypothetical protein OAT84_03615 [Gammaproteobacteria bacterium]|nr:hypothetical protein [Gammaproteobacteria bacterium]